MYGSRKQNKTCWAIKSKRWIRAGSMGTSLWITYDQQSQALLIQSISQSFKREVSVFLDRKRRSRAHEKHKSTHHYQVINNILTLLPKPPQCVSTASMISTLKVQRSLSFPCRVGETRFVTRFGFYRHQVRKYTCMCHIQWPCGSVAQVNIQCVPTSCSTMTVNSPTVSIPERVMNITHKALQTNWG